MPMDVQESTHVSVAQPGIEVERPSSLPFVERHEGMVSLPGPALRRRGTDVVADALGRIRRRWTQAPAESRKPATAAVWSRGVRSQPIQEPTAGWERRDFPRRMASGHVSVAQIPEGTSPKLDPLMRGAGVSGKLVDLSRNGIALILMQPISAGTHLAVRLSHPDHSVTCDMAAQVVRCLSIGSGLWKIVAHFKQEMSFDAAYEFFDRDEVAMS